NKMVKEKKWLIVFCVLLICIFAVFYPTFIIFSDETRYMHAISLFKEELKFKVTDPLDSHSFLYNGEDYTTQFPMGVTLLGYPFTLFGYKGLFVMNFGMLLIGFYFFNKILKKLGYNALYSLLYLLYPGFIFFSRTLMSELPSIALITIGIYFYIKEKNDFDLFYSGFFFSLAAIFRYPNFLTYLLIGVVLIYKEFKKHKFEFKRYKKSVLFIISAIPLVLSILGYNHYINGGIFNTSYSTKLGFGRDPVVHMLIYYFVSLNVVYPLMIFTPLLTKIKYKLEILLVTYLTLLSYIIIGIDTFHYDFLKNMVIGARYLFPVMPFFILGYIDVLNNVLIKLRIKRVLFILLVSAVLLIGAGVISYQQDDFTNKSEAVKEKIYATVPKNAIIYSTFSALTYLNKFYGDNKIAFIKNPGVYELMGKQNEEEYIVFALQGVYKEMSKGDYSIAEDELKGKFNLEKVYEENSPDSISIYKIIKEEI
ncbi:hypothetical protein ACFLYT_00300, partial [Nanoarchaeota archaeon]